MRKITIVANSFWNLYNFRFSLIKHLSNKYTITLIAPKDKYFINFKDLNCQLQFINLDSNKFNIFSDLFFILRIYAILFKIKPDYILNFTIKPVVFISFFSYFKRCKILNTITGFGTLYLKNRIFRKFFNFLYLISQRNIYKLIFQNVDDRDYFVKNKLIKINKTSLIPGSGVDTNFYRSYSYPAKNVINFLFLGRLIKEKGIIELIEAYEKTFLYNKNIKLTLVVKKSKKNPSNIISYIENINMKPNIEIIYDPNDVKKYIENSHCLILPSYREGLSKSCLEAMSMERPILVSNVPGCKQLVENNQNGFIFESITKNSICKVLKKFINLDNKTRIEMGKYSRKIIIEKYSNEIINKKYLSLLN